MIDEHGKAVTFLSLGENVFFGENGPIIWQLHFMLVLLKVC